ncbi:hypothetical protein CP533_6537 [Ophiocordyceps camponoti-saundersi (nom. inval.)]|nr:hypothetical protein CP533_6537 [Ophiocordyceps camponoti-saundersi (nom. inval.)]
MHLGLFRGFLIGVFFVLLASAKDEACLRKCLQLAHVTSFFQGQQKFSNLSSPFNIRLPFTPAAIITAECTNQVAEAVKCASGCGGFKVQARSGGHSYASHSLGGQNGSIIIDLAFLNQVEIKQDASADVGGGVRLGNLDRALFDDGKRAISHGTCAGIGFGGHSLHGGYGFESRLWGLSLDHIKSFEIVLANGTVVNASSKMNNDLFWAVRGAGESFGVVTKFNIRTQAAPESLVYWSFNLSDVTRDTPMAVAALQHIQDFALNTTLQDRRLSWGWFLNQTRLLVRGKFHGPLDEFNQRIAPEILRGLPDLSDEFQTVREVNWLQSQALHNHGTDEISKLAQPDKPGQYLLQRNFYAKSLTIAEPLTREALTAYVTYAKERRTKVKESFSWYSLVNLYGGPDSQINIYNGSWSSYGIRNTLWVFQSFGRVKLNDSFDNFLSEFIQGIDDAITEKMPDTRFGGYANYIDPGLSATEAHRLYYGSSYNRLLSIKKAVDPKNIFSNPLAIGVEGY